MEINRLQQEELDHIHNSFKAQLVDLCHKFNHEYLYPKSPYYPQAAYVQLSAVSELFEEIKYQLKQSIGQKWAIIYTQQDGQQGMGYCDHFNEIPSMIEALKKLKCRN